MARQYYYPDDEKSMTEKVRNRIFRKPVPLFPKTVVVETQFGCNAGCVFCQYPQLKDKLPRGKMSMALFEKIAKECAPFPVERFILCLDNEPLIDPQLAERYELLRQHCPDSVRNLTTNASMLTPARVEELIGTGRVDEVFMSINGHSKEVYEELMKLPYERTMTNVDAFCAWLKSHPDIRQKLRVRVNVVKTRRVAPEIPAMERRWKGQEGFELHVIDMDNRGDQLDMKQSTTVKDDEADMKPNTTCRRPFNTMVITWEGKAVLCCVDYRRDVILGDVNTDSVPDIWNGPRATQLRKEYLAGVFDNLKPCRTCKVKN